MATHLDSKQALQLLLAGNARFVAGERIFPNQENNRRLELTTGQHPLAAVLSCSDSRVPPEIVFDQGLGDLFIIRVAGNIAVNSHILASIEYAVEHLKVPLVMVLGHQKCGALTAALQGSEAEGSIADLLLALQPAVEKARQYPGDLLENAILANVDLTVKQLEDASPIVAHAVHAGEVKLVGAYYALESGAVKIISGSK